MSPSCGFNVRDTSPAIADCPGVVSSGTVRVQVTGYADLEIQVPLT
jgi:hypothetical protein